uniref:hypothetical protein n=1 Tax=Methanobrevibacter smithii TaxID=2173 RepID=UPI003FEDE069
MGRVNSDVHFFLEQHEQEIINCCKKAMSNKQILDLLKTKYGREVSLSTFKEFKVGLKITKGDFLETLLDEIQIMKTSGAIDESVRRWLVEEHEFEVSRATFSRFKKKYNLIDNEKDSRTRDKDSLTNRAITQKQITDNNVHQDNIDLAIVQFFSNRSQISKPALKTWTRLPKMQSTLKLTLKNWIMK